MREAVQPSAKVTEGATSTTPASGDESERVLLLECRLVQFRSAMDESRADADRVRTLLAESAAREADHARRYSTVHNDLAEARAEIASLHNRLHHSEAVRAELEGYLFETGALGDAAELVRLRREVLAQRQASTFHERSATRLRARVDELLMSRDALLTRIAEWQRLVRKDAPETVDLAEFMAELRRDILQLEDRNEAGERNEAALRERLVHAGVDPDAPLDGESPRSSAGETFIEETDATAARPVTDEDSPEGGDSGWIESADLAAGEAAGTDRVDATADRLDATADRIDVEVADLRDDEGAVDVKEAIPAGDPVEADDPVEFHDAAPHEPVAMDLFEDDPSLAAADDGGRLEESAVAHPDGPLDADAVAIASPMPNPAQPPPVASDPATGLIDDLYAVDPGTRASAYERLIPLLEGDNGRLAEHLHRGLADPHPRVRRRVVLAVATARHLAIQPLLEPLRRDPDAQVRHIVGQILRDAPAATSRAPAAFRAHDRAGTA